MASGVQQQAGHAVRLPTGHCPWGIAHWPTPVNGCPAPCTRVWSNISAKRFRGRRAEPCRGLSYNLESNRSERLVYIGPVFQAERDVTWKTPCLRVYWWGRLDLVLYLGNVPALHVSVGKSMFCGLNGIPRHDDCAAKATLGMLYLYQGKLFFREKKRRRTQLSFLRVYIEFPFISAPLFWLHSVIFKGCTFHRLCFASSRRMKQGTRNVAYLLTSPIALASLYLEACPRE